MTTHIRSARPEDVPTIVSLIHALAVYERLEGECRADAASLREHLFGARPACEVILAEVNGDVAGFALFFHNYSTFLTKPGVYLEDLFVKPEHRGAGVGRLLLQRLAEIALGRGCGRLEWAVLNWNTPAIGFYERLGAKPMNDWTVFRVTGDALAKLGSGTLPG
jgi:GNAT superfamily N-acetyltransferase